MVLGNQNDKGIDLSGVWGILEGLEIFSLEKKKIHREMTPEELSNKRIDCHQNPKKESRDPQLSSTQSNNWLPRETAVQEGS